MLLFFYGSDYFLLRNHISATVARLAPNEFDLSRYQGENERLITDLRTPPFFSERRVIVWILNILEATESPTSKLIFEAIEAIKSSPKTALIIAVMGTPDKRLKVFKALNIAAETEEFNAITPWDRRGQTKRIAALANSKNLRHLTRRTHEYLAEQFGSDFARADSELAKLANAYQADEIRDTQALECVSDGDAASVFDLTDALLDGNYGKAVRLAKRLEDAHEPALKVLATITNKFHGVYSVLIGAESPGISPAQARFFKNRYYGQAERILKALAILKKTTIQIKSGSPQWSELLIAIYKVCNV